MPPSPIPAPLPPWAKAVLYLAPLIPSVIGWLRDQVTNEKESDPVEWRRWTISARRDQPVGFGDDLAQFSLHIVNITGGDVDTTWTTTDYSDVQTEIDALVVALRANNSAALKYESAKAHLMAFNPAEWPTKRFQDSGPPQFVRSYGGTIPGALGNPLPTQVAMTVTFRNAFPGHWGRVYLPGFAGSQMDANGRFATATRVAIANAFNTLITNLAAKQFYVVTPFTQIEKQMAFGLLATTQVSVDDVPDVQRSRRAKQVAAREVRP